jgi:purine-nucleoside phosphorylase
MTSIKEIIDTAILDIASLGAVEPAVAIILGSGLGHVADAVEEPIHFLASTIEGYPPSTVEGHEGTFLFGHLSGVPVAVLSGRIHGYEGYPAQLLGLPARILCGLGPKALILTNAAGGIDPSFRPGDLMVIRDHLNLTGRSPLEGPNLAAWGPRFPDMSKVYPQHLRDLAHRTAAAEDLTLTEGVYACMPGPQYETPAEVAMLRTLGASAVGMSTVPEAIVARHMGVPVLALSIITNAAAGLSERPLSHDDVIEVAGRAGSHLARLLLALIPVIAGQD